MRLVDNDIHSLEKCLKNILEFESSQLINRNINEIGFLLKDIIIDMQQSRKWR